MPICYEAINKETGKKELTTDPNKAISDRMIIGRTARDNWYLEQRLEDAYKKSDAYRILHRR